MPAVVRVFQDDTEFGKDATGIERMVPGREMAGFPKVQQISDRFLFGDTAVLAVDQGPGQYSVVIEGWVSYKVAMTASNWRLRSNDGCRLWLNDILVINSWGAVTPSSSVKAGDWNEVASLVHHDFDDGVKAGTEKVRIRIEFWGYLVDTDAVAWLAVGFAKNSEGYTYVEDSDDLDLTAS